MSPPAPAAATSTPAAGPAGLVLRATRAEDAEGLVELVNQPGFRHGTMRLPFHGIDDVRQWHTSRSPANLSLVAVLDGKIVGQAGLQRKAGRAAHVAGLGMGVHDAFVGRGIGIALLAALIDAADNWLAILRIELSVYIDNAPAIALYRRHGFVVEGTQRAIAFRAGRYADALAMARLAPSFHHVPTPAVS